MSAADASLGPMAASSPISATLSLRQTLRFTRLLSHLKQDVLLVQPARVSTTEAPTFLPPSIKTFLAAAVGISESLVMTSWESLRDEIWELPVETLSQEEENLFRVHGWKIGISKGLLNHLLFLTKLSYVASMSLYPPSHYCTNPACGRKLPMKKATPRQVVIYTLSSGVVPAWEIQLYCPDCNTTYYPDYSVQHSRRTYYGGIPQHIQIGAHQFAEKKLIGLWVSLMLVAW